MNKTKKLKIIFLFLSKWCGLFRLAKHFTKSGLRILCYHNFSQGDEIYWRPKLFIRPEIFRKRMDFLEQEKMHVLSLNQAVELLFKKKLPPLAVVITMDDGWYSNKLYAADILAEKSYPWTIYLTSYYSMKETPIFSLVIKYMFWKTRKKYIDINDSDLPFAGRFRIPDSQLMNRIIDYGQSQPDNATRCALSRRIGELLDVAYDKIEKKRSLSLLTAPEIRELAKSGVDIQLHTHRHRWPQSKNMICREINENRSFIEMLTGKKAMHFCYPSGIWQPERFSCLTSLGIKSAVTCEPGINKPGANRYLLCRFLDGSDIHQMEFEAEISGYLEIFRQLRRFFVKLFKSKGRSIL